MSCSSTRRPLLYSCGLTMNDETHDRTAQDGRQRRRPVSQAESRIFRRLRGPRRRDLRAASARRPRDPDRRAPDRHAAREEQRTRDQAARADPVRRRERQISEKLHRSTLALFAAPDLETTLAVLYHSLKEDFGVPQVASRLWGSVPEQSYLPELAATSLELREYADQLGAPYCGPQAPFESRDWFERGGRMQSFAFLPLRTAHTFGLLGLASEDPRALLRRHGHRLSHAARGARKRATARYLPPV